MAVKKSEELIVTVPNFPNIGDKFVCRLPNVEVAEMVCATLLSYLEEKNDRRKSRDS